MITIGKPKTIRETTKKIEFLRLKYLNTLLLFCVCKKTFMYCMTITTFYYFFQARKIQGYQ